MDDLRRNIQRLARTEDDPSLQQTSVWCTLLSPDVICYLVPRSHFARGYVSQMARRNSCHVAERPRPEISKQPRAFALALRMSSRLQNPQQGFRFGRDDKRCDIHIDSDNDSLPLDRISDVHFSIFPDKDSGEPMIQDHSVHGTVVDGTVLKCQENGNAIEAGNEERDPQNTKALRDGSSVTLTLSGEPDGEMSFYVRLPNRKTTDEDTEAYESNLAAYRKGAVPSYRWAPFPPSGAINISVKKFLARRRERQQQSSTTAPAREPRRVSAREGRPRGSIRQRAGTRST
ncbi:CAMK protein kinase [Apiospora arundinis]